MIIKKIAPKSLGKVLGMLYGFMGLIFGLIFAVFSVIGFSGGVYDPMNALLFGVMAIIFLPLVYGSMGFLFGLIMAFLYNFSASWSGGIEIETE